MNRFSINTINYLNKSGWFHQRNIPIQLIKEEVIKNNGYWFNIVEKFLSEFGELTVHFKRKDNSADYFHFNARKANNDIDSTWVTDDYSQRIGKKLCIIGQAYSNHLTLCMDEEGKVYGGYDDFFEFIGNSGDEAIENICSNAPTEEIEQND